MPDLRARVLLIASVCILLVVPARAGAATWVGYPALLQQVRSGPLIRAIINHKRGDIEIKFRDLSEWEAFYPAGAQQELQRILHQRHVHVIFAGRPKAKAKPGAVHHHLRYIAAGILGALALLAAAWVLIRRRRPPAAAPQGGTAQAGAGAGEPRSAEDTAAALREER
jgi:hypothetical protein